ncbi:deoxyguanosinetriphosphate triphosphohydrolase [Neptunitalea lumnitzerae]|uniref:DGTPase n=1 Tax=Neptunitalea lumnitzerae TaxID=2965509 RepID=A0ABQ5MF29_9FLAO|nr:deoxyguanosinetriphosphate triphosphohydrolase [Neptunitalea sp. Y10]GLB48016.1 dGTPase [Neptunitalea sp. Y10]
MHWEQLLSLKKYGDTKKRVRLEQDETRLGFEVDYDRIIFSSAFRSLQDKTQVVPLSKTDFIHTRLTHSLEVSVVGRSLGRTVGKAILEKYPHLKTDLGYQITDFGAIVAAACLAHDIGNPPFGHSGEKAIGEFFSNGEGQQYKNQLTDKQWQDLIDFEGNANGFSVLNNALFKVEEGLRISYATLGAFTKYPKESLPKKPTSQIADKKYGFFQHDTFLFEDVAQELGLIKKPGDDVAYHRHPLAFLVEAADDICYTIIDFEDGINKGLIDEDYALEFLIAIVKDTINTQKYYELTTKEERISYLRALAIGQLIQDAVAVFLANEEAILQGEFHYALTEKSKFKAQISDIIKISVERIYRSRDVIEKELMGYRVLQTLLGKFCTAYMNNVKGTASNYDKLVLEMLPEKFKSIKEDTYSGLLSICQFVSLLTDGSAMEIYGILEGYGK